MGVRVSETKPEIRMATTMVTENSCSRRPTMPPMNSTGMNTATSEKVMERIVNPISRDGLDGGVQARFAHLHVADDVLQHHDGVIHHEAHRKGERHQRKIVQTVAQQVHHGERPHDGERHRTAWNQGGGEIAQEEEDHHHDDGDSEQQRELHVVDGAAYGLRRVEGDREIDGGRNLLAELAAAACLTLSTTSTVLVPGWRWMARMTARLLLYQATILSFSTLSMTLPSSSSRTGVPLR